MLANSGTLHRGLCPLQAVPARPASSAPACQRGAMLIAAQARRSDVLSDRNNADLINLARNRAGASRFSSSGSSGKIEVDPNADLVTKLKAAWRIFFPERRSLSPKEEGKKRLRMILVADRCGMSADSLSGMRESIVRAMTDYVELEAEEAVEVNLSMDPEIGTIYSVAVPVRRVKPALRPVAAEGRDRGAPAAWDPNDPDSDPSDQFPWGT